MKLFSISNLSLQSLSLKALSQGSVSGLVRARGRREIERGNKGG
jgi:hypothetical protein